MQNARSVHGALLSTVMILIAAGSGCGSCQPSDTESDGGGGAPTNQTSGTFSTGTEDCPVGSPCDGGTCVEGGACCKNTNLCGTICCSTETVCSFLECVAPGNACVDDKSCSDAEYCDFSVGLTAGGGTGGGGVVCQGGLASEGRCMPKPPICPDGTEPGSPPVCVTQCEYRPPTGVFAPDLKYAWGDPSSETDNVMMTPIVVQLDDDNCDGVINGRDIPEIVFFTFDGPDYGNVSGTSATLHAISVVGGEVVEKFGVKTEGESPDSPGQSIAGGDLDGDRVPEIVVCTVDGRIRAYDADGSVKWLSPPGSCDMPSIADLDHDGAPEVIDVGFVLEGSTGDPKTTLSGGEAVIVYDVDGDGLLDIVTPGRVLDADGQVKIDTGVIGTQAAVGDLDRDGVPEVIAVDQWSHSFSVWHVDGADGFEVIRRGVDINEGIDPNPCCEEDPNYAGCTRGGGPPTVARFNEDEFPDVGIAGGIGYVVFDGKKLMDGTPASDTRAWLTRTRDCSSAVTGSSVFDFDGDGIAEVVYADELTLHVYAGPTGEPLFETCNTNGTLVEYPVIADVDNDGHADIVVASNSYTGFACDGVMTTGIRVFGDLAGNWVRTRRIWNQHAYHVTNVTESGGIPEVEQPNHRSEGLNNFRQNIQPASQFSAPDLVVTLQPCAGGGTLTARVVNIGEAPVEPGVAVGFYAGSPPGGTHLGQALTTITIYPLGHEDVSISDVQADGLTAYAVVDDGMTIHPWHECRTDNNVSDPISIACGVPK